MMKKVFLKAMLLKESKTSFMLKSLIKMLPVAFEENLI